VEEEEGELPGLGLGIAVLRGISSIRVGALCPRSVLRAWSACLLVLLE
jgi:hypothetical protein